MIITGAVIGCREVDGISDLGVPRLKSIRVGPRSRVLNKEFTDNLE